MSDRLVEVYKNPDMNIISNKEQLLVIESASKT